MTPTLAEVLPLCDIVVGTEQEIHIAGGRENTLDALGALRDLSDALLVLKRGHEGCTVFAADAIASWQDGIVVPGFDVEVFNTLGAGDGFLAGFLSGWLAHAPLAWCAELGNACGALVVARHGCTPAMPSRAELERFLARDPAPRRPRTDDELVHLHRTTTWQDAPSPLFVLAFDHRRQLEALAAEAGEPFERIGRFKELVADAMLAVARTAPRDGRLGIIVDDRYGARVLRRFAGSGFWVARPVEVPGSRPLELDPRNDIGLRLAGWPADQVVKCLVFYHPDDELGLRLEQEARLLALWDDVVALDRRFVLEVILPPQQGASTESTLARALRRLYNLGIRPDWWKLEPQTADGWSAVCRVIAEHDPQCKGVVLLGLDADEATLARAFATARQFPLCRGFAVGRSIFGAAAREWLAGNIDDETAVERIAARYAGMIETWRSP